MERSYVYRHAHLTCFEAQEIIMNTRIMFSNMQNSWLYVCKPSNFSIIDTAMLIADKWCIHDV